MAEPLFIITERFPRPLAEITHAQIIAVPFGLHYPLLAVSLLFLGGLHMLCPCYRIAILRCVI